MTLRFAVLSAVALFLLTSCWAFEKTDDRPSPVADALSDAGAAFDEGMKQAPAVPGPAGWLIAVLMGGAAGASAFVTKLLARKKELDAKSMATPATAEVPPAKDPVAAAADVALDILGHGAGEKAPTPSKPPEAKQP